MNATGIRLPDDFVVGSYESKSPASMSASPMYTPRSSIRNPSPTPDLGDFVFSMEVDEPADDASVVNGRYYGMQMPRPPLRRQIATTVPREYYDSLAMVLPLQHVQIEHELAQAAHEVERKVAFQAAVSRARDDYKYRSIMRTQPGGFRNRCANTLHYIHKMNRISEEALNEAIACVWELSDD